VRAVAPELRGRVAPPVAHNDHERVEGVEARRRVLAQDEQVGWRAGSKRGRSRNAEVTSGVLRRDRESLFGRESRVDEQGELTPEAPAGATKATKVSVLLWIGPRLVQPPRGPLDHVEGATGHGEVLGRPLAPEAGAALRMAYRLAVDAREEAPSGSPRIRGSSSL